MITLKELFEIIEEAKKPNPITEAEVKKAREELKQTIDRLFSALPKKK